MTTTMEGMLEHARFMAEHMSRCAPRYVLVPVLLDLGVRAKHDGYDYLKNAIDISRENPGLSVMKGLYTAVGELYTPKVGKQQVEQAIRGAIDAAWKERDPDIWDAFFPHKKNKKAKKPSNADFIAQLVCFLDMWEGCCEEVRYERTK